MSDTANFFLLLSEPGTICDDFGVFLGYWTCLIYKEKQGQDPDPPDFKWKYKDPEHC
jgi:hypothetical protein